MKNAIILIFILLFFAAILSCDSQNKFTFSKYPVIQGNSKSHAPLTCFVDFEMDQPYKKVILNVKSSDHEFQLTYSPKDKKKAGYLILFMKPEKSYQIQLEFSNEKGLKYLHEN